MARLPSHRPHLASFALSPAARAVLPPPDGGYPNFNTAEGTSALRRCCKKFGVGTQVWRLGYARDWKAANAAQFGNKWQRKTNRTQEKPPLKFTKGKTQTAEEQDDQRPF